MPALMVMIGADASKAEREFIQLQVAAQAAARKIELGIKNNSEGQKHWNGVMHEGMVLLREISRGNWTRVPGSASLFVQRLNDQLPFLKALLNPITLAFAAMGAMAAYVLVKTIKHFKELEDSAKELNNILRPETWKYWGDAAEEAAKKIQKLNDWLKHVRDSEKTIRSDTQDKIKLMRDEFEWQQKIADAKGQTKEQKESAELAEQKKENAEMSNGVDAAHVASEEAIEARTKAAQDAANPDVSAAVKDSGEERKKAETIKNAVEQQYRDYYGSPLAKSKNDSSKNEKFTVKIDGKEFQYSLNEVNNTFQKASDRATAWSDKQESLNDAATEAEKKEAQATRDYHDLKEQYSKDTAKTKLQEQYGSAYAKAIEAKENAKKERQELFRGASNSLQKIGAYSSPQEIQMTDIAKKQLAVLYKIQQSVSRGGSGSRGGRF